MIRILIITSLLGCESLHERLTREVKEFCSCHGGLNSFLYSSYSFRLECNDGVVAEGNGTPMDRQHFLSDCEKKAEECVNEHCN